MIRLSNVRVTYADADRPALVTPDLRIPEGDLVLAVGPTGSGKSTLLRAINGLVPHFSGGHLDGHVLVDGRDTREHRPRDLADVVGFVGQDPLASFVTETVEEEIAYGMETLAISPAAMRRRVEESLDVLGVADLRTRPLRELSGGQQQRVAVAAVLAAGPRVLVLDEPTSSLDPVSAEDVLAAVHRLVHDLGVTVLMAEHRLERVIHHADQVLLVQDGVVSELLPPEAAMRRSPVAPPVVRLGRRMGWEPLPLSIREARRRVRAWDGRVAAGEGGGRRELTVAGDGGAGRGPAIRPSQERPTTFRSSASLPRETSRGTAASASRQARPRPAARPTTPGSSDDPVRTEQLHVRRRGRTALHELDLVLPAGRVTALMGRNGAGKSTLLGCLAGIVTPTSGRALVDGVDPRSTRPRALVKHVGLVPQDAGTLLYHSSVAAECSASDRDLGLPSGTTRSVLDRLAPHLADESHPRDLSEGGRVLLALAVVLAARPPVLLLDEPTRGLDYGAKARLGALLREEAAAGRTVGLATHDVEVAAEYADEVALLADGELIGQGLAREILCDSPAFAPQVAKVMHPLPYLTVDEVPLPERAGEVAR